MVFRLFKTVVPAIILAIGMSGCATPVHQEVSINEQELQQEIRTQQDMAKQYKPKPLKSPQHDIAYYQKRLNRVAKPLQATARKMCKRGTCNFKYKVANQNVLNAWADGHTVHITPIMMDFLETDKELALILSHELAHNTLNHVNKTIQNSLMGSVLDIAAAAAGVNTGGLFGQVGADIHAKGFENEADYIGLYIMHNAGYDITDSHKIWRKMSIQSPRNIGPSFFSTHPSNAERYLRMGKTIKRIQTESAQQKKSA